MIFYRRTLPHWHPEGVPIFLTWRLFGSLPASPKRTATKPLTSSFATHFKRLDAALDKAPSGPLWLTDSAIACAVKSAIHFGAENLDFYDLHAFVIMPNHVHLLITPKVSVPRLTNGLKGVTSRHANAILGRTRQHFWQDESFDHWVRSPAQLESIRTYVEYNPVIAGLAEAPEDWPWSSASRLSRPSRPSRPSP